MIYQSRLTRSGRGVLIPHSSSFFKDNPASRTASVISIPNNVFFSQYRIPCQKFSQFCFLKVIKLRIPSKNVAFFLIPHCISIKSRIPKIPFQTLGQGLPGSHILDLYGNRFALFIPGIMFYSFIEVKEGLPKECFLRLLN